ncbi:hypothetical protein [Simiduia agarivorans]|uniref:Lipoprotein n=1 Tax=Simiduia agarivorans (strain DSM 21679 / JCM 13881 / BCRC 17597 / SA1) TaxID=1117647 RepID=K4KGX3_SIMAS|nr:hypothetical protein [Simiduia agarivorans]AFU98354.1 hypothetical protein M5M_05755 [Simiduia agarivorans SA1 = DSM 21679]
MRKLKLGLCLLVCCSLVGCATSLIVGNQMQNRLMGALIKPLVGFDPNDVNLFEIPVVKERMTNLLGEHYEPTMALLRTAQEIQQEGALYYVVSRYAPEEVTQYTNQAAMIWNADTNQLAVLLIEDGLPAMFAEPVEGMVEAITPTLPTELVEGYEQAVAYKQQIENTHKQLQALPDAIEKSIQDSVEHTVQDSEPYKAYSEVMGYKQSLEKTKEQVERIPDEVEKSLQQSGEKTRTRLGKSATSLPQGTSAPASGS